MTSQKERQKKLLMFLGFLVIIIIVIMYFGFFDKGDEEAVLDSAAILGGVSLPGSVDLINIRAISNINLDLDFLKSENFLALEINGNIPIKPQIEGRENPFVSY